MVLLQIYAMSIGFKGPCGAPGGGRLALAYAVVYHACVVIMSSAGLLGLVLFIFELGLQESKTFTSLSWSSVEHWLPLGVPKFWLSA